MGNEIKFLFNVLWEDGDGRWEMNVKTADEIAKWFELAYYSDDEPAVRIFLPGASGDLHEVTLLQAIHGYDENDYGRVELGFAVQAPCGQKVLATASYVIDGRA